MLINIYVRAEFCVHLGTCVLQNIRISQNIAELVSAKATWQPDTLCLTPIYFWAGTRRALRQNSAWKEPQEFNTYQIMRPEY